MLFNSVVQKSVVNPFLVASNPLLLKFVSPEYDIRRYTPSSDTPHSKFITDLRLPDLGGNPDLLLDRLGEDPELRALISYIVQIRMNTRSKYVNTVFSPSIVLRHREKRMVVIYPKTA